MVTVSHLSVLEEASVNFSITFIANCVIEQTGFVIFSSLIPCLFSFLLYREVDSAVTPVVSAAPYSNKFDEPVKHFCPDSKRNQKCQYIGYMVYNVNFFFLLSFLFFYYYYFFFFTVRSCCTKCCTKCRALVTTDAAYFEPEKKKRERKKNVTDK